MKSTPFRPLLAGLKATGLLIAALGAILLSSCASTTNRSPSAGMAMFDATPDSKRRDRIDGIRVSAVNDKPVRGSELELTPGWNKVRVGYKWPQGGEQEVDLKFDAHPDRTYVVYYDVHPPSENKLGQRVSLDAASAGLLGAASQMGEGAFLMFPPLIAMGTGAMAVRAGNEIAEDTRPAKYVDVMVVAQQCSQGVTCVRRVYPDGRIEKR